MQAQPPVLLPLLRSRLQADLLTLIMLTPGQEWKLTDLARRVGASAATVGREVTRAEQAGIVTARWVGNTRLVTRADSPLTEPLTELLLRAFGPRQVISEELAPVTGVERAFIFGSWAARYLGIPGRPPADIDVLVIGAPDRDDLDDAVQRATERLAREVNTTIRSPHWWTDGMDGFHTELTTRPLVPVFPTSADSTPQETKPDPENSDDLATRR